MDIDLDTLKEKIAEIYAKYEKDDGWKAWSELCAFLAAYENSKQ